MLTFLLFMSTIHGCSSMRHGVARLFGSFSRLHCSCQRRHASLPIPRDEQLTSIQ